jgi:hypothetical protein
LSAWRKSEEDTMTFGEDFIDQMLGGVYDEAIG